jgi:DNA-binding NarL/FixJ family response regulator
VRTPIRIIVVDDYEPWRRFLRLALLPYPELQVIGEFADGPEAIQKAKELLPDLILLDIGLPTLNGIEAARCIQKVSPDSKILFVSEERLSSVAEEAMRTGASGYVVKSDAAIELLLAIKSILEGKQFFSLRISSSGPSRH